MKSGHWPDKPTSDLFTNFILWRIVPSLEGIRRNKEGHFCSENYLWDNSMKSECHALAFWSQQCHSDIHLDSKNSLCLHVWWHASWWTRGCCLYDTLPCLTLMMTCRSCKRHQSFFSLIQSLPNKVDCWDTQHVEICSEHKTTVSSQARPVWIIKDQSLCLWMLFLPIRGSSAKWLLHSPSPPLCVSRRVDQMQIPFLKSAWVCELCHPLWHGRL